LIVAVIVVAFDGSVLDGSVHSFDLSIRPGVFDLGQPVVDIIFAAAPIEHVGEVGCGRAISVTRWQGERDAIVGQDRVDLVRHGCDERFQEGRCGFPVRFLDELDEGEFARAIDGDKKRQLSFRSLDFRYIDMKVANRIAFELLLVRLIAVDIRLMPWRRRQRCSEDRVRRGMVGCNA
jgi:hypothetical protein